MRTVIALAALVLFILGSANAADLTNLLANPGFERTLWIGAKKWRFPANRTFSWTEFSPIKDFLQDPKGYKIQ